MKQIPAILLCLAALALSGCKEKDKKKKTKDTPQAFPVTTLENKTIEGYKDYPAHMEGFNVDVRVKVQGYVKQVLIDEGLKVKKGQPLFTLETDILNQQAAAAKKAVRIAKLKVEELTPLVEKGIVSPMKLEEAKLELAKSQASYNETATKIDYAVVRSPDNGYIGTINYGVGSLVSPGDSKPIATMSNIDISRVFFHVSEAEYLNFLKQTKGKSLAEKSMHTPPVTLILANGDVYPKKGKMETSDGKVDVNTGTVKFRAVFDNSEYLLRNGNSATIRVPLVYKDVIAIPQQATYEEQNHIMVFKLNKDNTATASRIEIAARVRNLYVVTSGLKAGDKIVAIGSEKLRDGIHIIPKEVPLDSVLKPIKPLFRN